MTCAALQNQSLVLASHESKPLLEDVQVINKVSQNLHAEILLRLLGREKGTRHGSRRSGGGAWIPNNAEFPATSMCSTTVRDSRGKIWLRPTRLCNCCATARAQPWGKSFRDTLPVAAWMARSRIVSTKASGGRVGAKTGSLGGVKTLSGYATTDRGDQVAFAILSNNFNLKSVRPTPAHLPRYALGLAMAERAHRAGAGAGGRLAHSVQQVFQDCGIVVPLIPGGEQKCKILLPVGQAVKFDREPPRPEATPVL